MKRSKKTKATHPNPDYNEIYDDPDAVDLLQIPRESFPETESGEDMMKFSSDKIAEAQHLDEFYQQILSTVNPTKWSQEVIYGVLLRTNPDKENALRILFQTILIPRVLQFSHYARIAGHPGQKLM